MSVRDHDHIPQTPVMDSPWPSAIKRRHCCQQSEAMALTRHLKQALATAAALAAIPAFVMGSATACHIAAAD